MITAVDTNILLDILLPDPHYGQHSKASLTRCMEQGSLIACDVVWAETAAFFRSPHQFQEVMEVLKISFTPLTRIAAESVGAAWRLYRAAGGKRERVIADFLIGSHAVHQANRLLTRDRGFYKKFFKTLAILDPSSMSMA